MIEKKGVAKKITPPKRKVESTSIAEETPQPQEEPIELAKPPKIVVEVERETTIKLIELARRQTRTTRVLSQDLLDLFPSSSSLESTRIRWGHTKARCRDAIMRYRGWDVFHAFYGNMDQPSPISNPWKLNLGRLVVPNVFIEPMLIEELANKFDPPSLTIRNLKG